MRIYMLGLGTNLGNREKNIQECHNYLKNMGTIEEASTMHETKPFGVREQPMFLNQVIKFSTTYAPEELFRKVKAIEKEMKRTPTIRHGPRIIDIDILWCDQYQGTFTREKSEVTIPHKEMRNREETVLKPLREITTENEYQKIVCK